MQSQFLKRKYKMMYKNDINALQLAFRRIFKTDLLKISGGHFCRMTELYVKKFQEDRNISP
jgi:hypothetical protein